MIQKFLDYRVGAYMAANPTTVRPDMSLAALRALFEEKDFNGFPVVEAGNLVGFVTKIDFLKAFAFSPLRMVPDYDELMARPVRDVMTTAVVHVEAESPLTRALQLMIELKARSFPVLDRAGSLKGIIAREDIMRALRDATKS
jgi:CBS domain-containing protein